MHGDTTRYKLMMPNIVLCRMMELWVLLLVLVGSFGLLFTYVVRPHINSV